MQINTKSYKSNKLLRLSRSFSLKRLLTPQVRLPLPKWTRAPLEQERPQAQTILAKIKKLTRERNLPDQTGEWASSMTTMTKISTTRNKIRLTMDPQVPTPSSSWARRSRWRRKSWASTLLADKRKRTREVASSSVTTPKLGSQSWAKRNQLLMTCEHRESDSKII